LVHTRHGLAGDRPTTAVTSQTLFLLNGPLLKDASRKLALDLLTQTALTNDADRLAALYVRVLNRRWMPEEASVAQSFVTSPAEPVAGTAAVVDDAAAPWQRLIQALLVSNGFLFRL